MLRDADEIRRAFANAGWTVDRLGGGLRIEGRDYDLTTVVATRGDLRAFGEVLRGCEDGDSGDAWMTLHASRTRAVRREGTVKLGFEVYDFGRARAELEQVLPLLNREDFLGAIAGALAARGWTILDDGRSASADWDFSWQIVAARAGDEITVGVLYGGSGGDGTITEVGQGTAWCHLGAAKASVRWRSATEARALIAALVG
jgi:hypothetical protein